ncbi:MAG TPA: DNA polymerase III subunit gamma/tau [Smithellaceae bacterium]|nr:DNA polymerase III subunit gamma/tau [Smithellaceae bacterium]HRS89337.1 DNA polymerase III subunit gamma/tau [Smithellaceae bacterium]HRV26827.1 DNA polymerase III subunit gamma/tau [Smithellaceae bacterium]
MEYLVLARKFRPQTFEDVSGQEHVVKTLKNAIGQGRVAHAFLFSGPRGVGKTSIARILAKSLNCEKGPSAIPCNECSNCKEITDGRSLDVREIDGASNRGIDEIRELRENVKFAPASSKYKIYIIDEVHMLTREAFNALLKTLEEPPGHVIFVFATTESHKVPATILSRCQCYDFRRISLKEIIANLEKVAEKEGIQISKTALGWIAEAGDGSMRDAQSIFDQVISYAGKTIRDEDVEENLGLADKKYLFVLSEAVIKRDAGACLNILEEAYLAGIDMKHFYQRLLKHFRDLLLVKIAGDGSSSFDIAPEQIEKLKNQCRNTTRETLQRYLEILISQEDALRRSQETRMKLETIIVKMAYLEPIVPLGEIISAIEDIEQRIKGGLSPTDCGKTNPQAHRAALDTDANQTASRETGNCVAQNMEELSAQFKSFIKKENAPLGAKIDTAEVVSHEDNCLVLGIPQNSIFLEDIKSKPQLEKLRKIACKFFGSDVELKITPLKTEKTNAYGNNSRGRANNINEIKREAINHPILQKVMDEFSGARVIEIKARLDED